MAEIRRPTPSKPRIVLPEGAPLDRRNYKTRATGWAAVVIELLRSERAFCGAALLISLLSMALVVLHLSGAIAGIQVNVGPLQTEPSAIGTQSR